MTNAPAPRPCESCPYRRDVPSGIWDASEYEKLRLYDHETALQPLAMFQCHQEDADSPHRRVCAGWAGCHDGDELLALRLAVATGRIDADTFTAIVEYVSPVELFASGTEAADHGQMGIDSPNSAAIALMDKITRRRDI